MENHPIALTRSVSQAAVMSALFKARSKFVKVKKDRRNTHFNNQYATLDSVLDAITPALTDEGLFIEQFMIPTSDEGALHLVTEIWHESGEYRSYYLRIPIVKKDPQGVGSAFTYARRYALCGIFGLSQADDDAQIAVKSAQDWKKDFTKAETLDGLMEVYKQAYRSSDEANRKIVIEAYEKRKAELTVKTAKGFNPAKPKPATQPVDNSTSGSVESTPEAQEIDNF
ncbi:ERF family protein [Gibbsiella quercinecans]|uniref:ERF family protein n=1 Tax=Gibbsiella quercinecans TaxID=929813 RepID=UPI00242C5049|nr:ERF family protein [Gibbsiella quercinecans]